MAENGQIATSPHDGVKADLKERFYQAVYNSLRAAALKEWKQRIKLSKKAGFSDSDVFIQLMNELENSAYNSARCMRWNGRTKFLA
ncbi:MAG: hypothetical protein G01um101470_973 [Parcubacteria group bacterium Gr01-1014_70]|nr:MAG: hypothetical protein G01um101470_973 [Parcubacteria group bacterium Gr01-1014_70]